MKPILALAASFLWLIAPPVLRAEPLNFPADDPSFSVNLSEPWRMKTDEDGSIRLVRGDGTKLVTMIRRRTSIQTDDQLKEFLLKSVRKVADGLKLTDLTVGELTQSTNPHKITMFKLTASGKEPDGTELVLPLAGFAPRKGTYFVISAISPADVYTARQKEYAEVVNAIGPRR